MNIPDSRIVKKDFLEEIQQLICYPGGGSVRLGNDFCTSEPTEWPSFKSEDQTVLAYPVIPDEPAIPAKDFCPIYLDWYNPSRSLDAEAAISRGSLRISQSLASLYSSGSERMVKDCYSYGGQHGCKSLHIAGGGVIADAGGQGYTTPEIVQGLSIEERKRYAQDIRALAFFCYDVQKAEDEGRRVILADSQNQDAGTTTNNNGQQSDTSIPWGWIFGGGGGGIAALRFIRGFLKAWREVSKEAEELGETLNTFGKASRTLMKQVRGFFGKTLPDIGRTFIYVGKKISKWLGIGRKDVEAVWPDQKRSPDIVTGQLKDLATKNPYNAYREEGKFFGTLEVGIKAYLSNFAIRIWNNLPTEKKSDYENTVAGGLPELFIERFADVYLQSDKGAELEARARDWIAQGITNPDPEKVRRQLINSGGIGKRLARESPEVQQFLVSKVINDWHHLDDTQKASAVDIDRELSPGELPPRYIRSFLRTTDLDEVRRKGGGGTVGGVFTPSETSSGSSTPQAGSPQDTSGPITYGMLPAPITSGGAFMYPTLGAPQMMSPLIIGQPWMAPWSLAPVLH